MFATLKTLNRWSLRLSMLAIAAFLLLGTLSSLPRGHDQPLLADLLHWLPLALIVLNMPLLLAQAFVLWRLRLSTPQTLLAILITATGLFGFGWYFGGAAWLGIPWVFKWNLQGFEKFLHSQATGATEADAETSPLPKQK